jgi:hypothetical protein
VVLAVCSALAERLRGVVRSGEVDLRRRAGTVRLAADRERRFDVEPQASDIVAEVMMGARRGRRVL